VPLDARRILAALVALVSLGCDAPRDAVHTPSHAHAPDPVSERTGEEPPPLPSTIEACAAELARRTPAEVSATLEDLAYETVFRDACTAARAEADRSLSLCADLSVTVLRDRCRERVAIAAGDPSGCPEARADVGRAPLCLALARRDARLCAAAGTLDRAVCEAVLVDGDDHPGRSCGRLPGELRAPCIARSERLARLATGERVATEAAVSSLTMHVGDEPARALGSAERGARVIYEACIPMLVLGEERVPGVALHGPGSLMLRVPLGSEPPIEAHFAALAASLEVSTPELRGAVAESGHVSLTVLERELGGAVEGTFAAELRGSATPVHVEGAFTTFVRDVEPRPEGCPSP
jgi:hypothetical protein